MCIAMPLNKYSALSPLTPPSQPVLRLPLQVLAKGPGLGSAVVDSWIGVIVVLLALVMNEATVDSLQNGMSASISGQYLKNLPLVWTR